MQPARLPLAALAMLFIPAAGADKISPDLGGITYYAPKTDVSVKLNLVLIRCDGGQGGLLATGETTIAATASRDPESRAHLDGAQLASWRTKRDVSITLSENLTIQSINAGAEDRLGATFISVLKTGLGLAAFAAAPARTTAESPCNARTNASLALRSALEKRLARARTALATGSGSMVEDAKTIDRLVLDIAALDTGPLALSLTAPVPLDRQKMVGQPIRWTIGDLAKWFGQDEPASRCVPVEPTLFDPPKPSCGTPSQLFALVATVADVANGVPAGTPDRSCFGAAGEGNAACRNALLLVEPAEASVTINVAGSSLAGLGSGSALGRADIVVPQWGRTRMLSLKAAFGQSRTVAMTFDAFSRPKQYTWKSDARAENIAGTAASVAETAAAVSAKIGGAEVAAWKAEIDRLETQRKRNALLLCRNAIEQGATVCPVSVGD